jgi:transposase
MTMQIDERRPGDLGELLRKASHETNAKQRDRFRAVALALQGHTTPQIRHMLARSKNFVQRWNYAYRDGGIGALLPKPNPGRPVKLSRQQEQAFKQRMLAGPTEDDAVCTLRAKEASTILHRYFGVPYSLPGVYALLHRLGLSCLKPRPLHRKNDSKAMEQWLHHAPLLSSKSETTTPTKPSRSGSRTKRGWASKEP